MNKQKFVEYLRTPSDLDRESLVQLEALVNDYPYFQGARTLLAKGSKILKSKSAGANISSAAVYATDRALLKRYINDELIFLSPLTVHESHEADRERDLTDTIKTNRITTAQSKQITQEEAPKPKPQPKPIIQDETPAPEPPMPETGKPSDLDHIIDELYRDLEELKINRAKFNKIENELAEEEAVDNAVKKATQKTSEESETKEETPEEAPVAKETPIEITPPEEPKAEVENEAEAPEEAKVPESDEPAAPKTDEPEADPEQEKPREIVRKPSESRSARVSRITEENEPLEPKKTKAESKKVAKEPAKAKATKAAGKTKPTTTKQKPESKKKSADTPKKKAQKKDKKKSEEGNKKDDKGEPKRVNQDDIITNFIKSNPSISPASKAAANAQVDLSGTSTELHPEIASEYLAEIYLAQGKKDRAIQIYEALIVRFPEKTTYFADIIKKINQ
ncbi:tetratricopeptide repeat protein [Marinoscillum sp.]|uniref:tetratricopeptide repeat protein n=1 Tax=Marinoscillum sp. TaxID=2024838 RepID=UPI003BAAD20B